MRLMRFGRLSLVPRFGARLLAATLLVPAFFAVAEAAAPKKRKPKAESSASAATSEPDASPAKPADATGKRGILPFDQAIIDANKTLAAGLAGGALDDAVAAYRKAIAIDPARPEGHLYLGAALYQKADYTSADEALTAAIARSKSDPAFATWLGKAMFLRAMTFESAGKPDEAKAAWQAYGAFAKEHPDQDPPKGSGDAPPMPLRVHPGTATERETKLELNARLREEYGKVKVLIEKRQRELDGPTK